MSLEKLADLHNSHILVVDDAAPVVGLLQEQLSGIYAKVSGTTNPQEVLRIVESAEQPIRAIVLDLDMPKLNGIGVLKELDHKGYAMPTVFYSATQGNHLAVQLFERMQRLQSAEELEQYMDDIARATEDLPVTYMRKFSGGEHAMQLLTNAIDSMMLVRQRTTTSLAQLAEQFTIEEAVSAPHNPHLTQIADLVLVTRQEFLDFANAIPAMAIKERNSLVKLLMSSVKYLEGEEYSVTGLTDEQQGRSRLHALQAILDPKFMANQSDFIDYACDDLITADDTYKEKILALKEVFLAKYQSFAGAFEYHRLSSKDFSRKRYCALDKLVQEALPDDIWANRMADYRRKEHIFTHDIEPNIIVDAHNELVNHLLMHPVLNAIDAVRDAREKQITLTARKAKTADLLSKPQYKNEYSAVIQIKDTGHGIPQEILEKIFADGFTTKLHGTGHGLAFVQEQTKKMGGTYQLESSTQGTTLTLYLPAIDKIPSD